MTALASEGEAVYRDANEAWKSYEQFLTRHPKLSEPERQRARGMVWYRMALNARRQADLAESVGLLPMLPFDPIEKPKPLRPGAEECLRKSIELAPDWLEPHAALFEELQETNKPAQAIQAGYKLLKLFPDHLPTMVSLATLERQGGHIEKAERLMEQAFDSNPLDRNLKRQFGRTRRLLGLKLTEQGKYEEARAAFQSALELIEPIDDLMPLCGWAACEYKAGDASRAGELVARARQREENRPAIDAYMTALATAFKLPKQIKSSFDKSFKEWHSATLTAGQAAGLALLFSRYDADDFEYHGRKSHEKKALALVGKAVNQQFTEPEMVRFGAALTELSAVRMLRQFAIRWKRKFPASPHPLLFEIDSYLSADDSRWPLWRLKPLAHRAKQLAEQLPAGAERDAALARIEDLLQQFHDLNPFSSLLGQFAGGFGEGRDDHWEDDEPW
jgi:tetratricopeptide (TPR) repeat protein